MKQSLILLFAVLSIQYSLKAQEVTSTYKNAIGIKALPGGFTFKHFISDKTAVEALAYFDHETTRITGLYELHYDLGTSLEGLNWYMGGGAHIGNWTNVYKGRNPNRTNNSTLGVGVDGVIGVDYKVDALPINIGVDWQPSLNLIGYTYYEGLTWGGVAIRYTF